MSNLKTSKEILELFREPLPDEAVTVHSVRQKWDGSGTIELKGYKWQYLVKKLNEDTNNSWSWEVDTDNVHWDSKNKCCIVFGKLTVVTSDGVMTRTGEGTSLYSYREIVTEIRGFSGTEKSEPEIVLDRDVVLKSAIDDAFARACVKFEIGMQAYLGQENRSTKVEKATTYKKLITTEIKVDGKKDELIQQLDDLRNTKNAGISDPEKFSTFLIKYGFDYDSLPKFESDEMEFEYEGGIYKLIDFSNLKKLQLKNLIEFVLDKHPVFVARRFVSGYKEKYDRTEIKGSEWGRVGKLAKNYGSKIIEALAHTSNSCKNITAVCNQIESQLSEKTDMNNELNDLTKGE